MCTTGLDRIARKRSFAWRSPLADPQYLGLLSAGIEKALEDSAFGSFRVFGHDAVDEELLVRNEYLVAENRVLRHQIQGHLRLTDGERRSLAEIGKRLGKQALDEIASIVKPDTILGWHRRLVAKKFDGSKNPFGQKFSSRAVRDCERPWPRSGEGSASGRWKATEGQQRGPLRVRHLLDHAARIPFEVFPAPVNRGLAFCRPAR